MISPAAAAEQLLAGPDAGRFVTTTTTFPPRVAEEVRVRADAIEETQRTLPTYVEGVVRLVTGGPTDPSQLESAVGQLHESLPSRAERRPSRSA